jgi:predicted alpha/beta superfamily hydrolase
MRERSGSDLSKQIPPVVVVGIGYPKAGHGFSANWVGRSLDFTPPVDRAQADRVLRDLMDESKAYGYETPTAVGGALEFLTFIRQELIPSITRDPKISRTGLFHMRRGRWRRPRRRFSRFPLRSARRAGQNENPA